MAKSKKKAGTDILKNLRNLVAQATEGSVEYEVFKDINEALTADFAIFLGASFKGFSLSESFQLMWIDPDVYLASGSFMQRWLASEKKVHPSSIKETTVPKYIYLFLQHRYGDFKSVSLVSPSALPNINDLQGAPDAPAQGMLLEVTLAHGLSYRERGYFDDTTRLRRMTSELPIVTGERDAITIPTGGRSPARMAEDLRGTAARICCEDGDIGELTQSDFLTNGVSQRVQQDETTNEHVQKYVYRDTEGELHECNFEGTTGPTLTEMFNQIRDIEQALSAPTPVEPEAPAPEGPATAVDVIVAAGEALTAAAEW